MHFEKVKELRPQSFPWWKTSAYRLASSIRKTQKRSERAQEYHDPDIPEPGNNDWKCTGGEGQEELYEAEGT